MKCLKWIIALAAFGMTFSSAFAGDIAHNMYQASASFEEQGDVSIQVWDMYGSSEQAAVAVDESVSPNQVYVLYWAREDFYDHDFNTWDGYRYHLRLSHLNSSTLTSTVSDVITPLQDCIISCLPSTTHSAAGIDMQIDAAGKIHIVYSYLKQVDGSGVSDRDLCYNYVSIPAGGSPTAPETIFTVHNHSAFPGQWDYLHFLGPVSIAVNSSGIPGVAFELGWDTGGALNTKQSNVFFLDRVPDPTWGPWNYIRLLGSFGNLGLIPDWAFQSSDIDLLYETDSNPCIAYSTSSDVQSWNIYCRRWNGSSWASGTVATGVTRNPDRNGNSSVSTTKLPISLAIYKRPASNYKTIDLTLDKRLAVAYESGRAAAFKMASSSTNLTWPGSTETVIWNAGNQDFWDFGNLIFHPSTRQKLYTSDVNYDGPFVPLVVLRYKGGFGNPNGYHMVFKDPNIGYYSGGGWPTASSSGNDWRIVLPDLLSTPNGMNWRPQFAYAKNSAGVSTYFVAGNQTILAGYKERGEFFTPTLVAYP